MDDETVTIAESGPAGVTRPKNRWDIERAHDSFIQLCDMHACDMHAGFVAERNKLRGIMLDLLLEREDSHDSPEFLKHKRIREQEDASLQEILRMARNLAEECGGVPIQVRFEHFPNIDDFTAHYQRNAEYLRLRKIERIFPERYDAGE